MVRERAAREHRVACDGGPRGGARAPRRQRPRRRRRRRRSPLPSSAGLAAPVTPGTSAVSAAGDWRGRPRPSRHVVRRPRLRLAAQQPERIARDERDRRLRGVRTHRLEDGLGEPGLEPQGHGQPKRGLGRVAGGEGGAAARERVDGRGRRGVDRHRVRDEGLDLAIVGVLGRPDRAARHAREQRVERLAGRLDRPVRQPSRLRGPPGGGDGLRRDHERDDVVAAPVDQGDRGVAGAREVARAPARLREVEQPVVIEQRATRQRLELGARQRERAEPEVHARQAQGGRPALGGGPRGLAGLGHRGSRRCRSSPRRCRAGATTAIRSASSRNSSAARRVTSADRTASTDVEGLVEREHAVVERLLAADPRREVARVVHPQLEAAREVRLGLRQLLVGDRVVDHADELGQDRLDGRGQLVGVDARGDLERPRVRVLDDARAHVVGEALLLAHAEEQPARHPVAEHAVEHGQRPGVGMVAAQRGDRDRELGLGRVALAGQDARPGGKRGGGLEARQRAVAGPEGGRRQRDGLVVLEVARDRDDGVRRAVHRPPEVADRAGRQGTDAGLVAADLAAQRPLAEQRLLDEHLGVLGRVVEVRADLLDDDRPLLVDVGVVERGVHDQLAEHGHRGRRPRAAGRGPSRRWTRDRWRRSRSRRPPRPPPRSRATTGSPPCP